MLPVKKERHISEATRLVISVGRSLAIAVAIFSAGVVANQRVGAVLVELADVKREQAEQRKILEEAVTKDYFAWRMEQATEACYTRALAKVFDTSTPIICPNFPTRGKPYICHLFQQREVR